MLTIYISKYYYYYYLQRLVKRISVCAALNLAIGIRSIGHDNVVIPYSLKKSIDLLMVKIMIVIYNDNGEYEDENDDGYDDDDDNNDDDDEYEDERRW